jgi:glycosyltransferase involved in cell wall biosynthesis
MRILVTAASHAYSFILQGEAVAKGFSKVGVENRFLSLDQLTDIPAYLNEYQPDCLLAIGNWKDFDLLVKSPQKSGYRVIPWIVSDDYVIDKFIDDYNQLPLILTPSNHCKDNLVRSGMKKEIIQILPEAVDNEFWRPAKEDEIPNLLSYLSVPIPCESEINKYDLSDVKKREIPIIYTTGGDVTKKGAREVIEALSLLDKKIPWIYLIKTWPGVVTFQNTIEELNLAKKLYVLDRFRYLVGEYSRIFMRDLMNLCDIYAGPSRIEGFGLPLVEAQMCGKPVVTCFGTSTQETVVQEKTGLICKGEAANDNLVKANIIDLSRCLEDLITNPSLRQEMGKNARTHAQNNYSPEVIAQQFLTIIDNL